MLSPPVRVELLEMVREKEVEVFAVRQVLRRRALAVGSGAAVRHWVVSASADVGRHLLTFTAGQGGNSRGGMWRQRLLRVPTRS